MTPSDPFYSSFDAAKSDYESAWQDSNNTRFELPAIDVNDVLDRRYKMSPKHKLTRENIWEMETKKAWDPFTYIPYVVSEGHSWGRKELPDGSTRFCRSSIQKGWITSERGRVLEDVCVGSQSQGIYFMGCQRFPDENGNELKASTFQPIFHVWHGVGGAEDQPTNLWSIVLLTPKSDPRFEEPFKEMVRAGFLPGFIEIYINKDLGVALSRL